MARFDQIPYVILDSNGDPVSGGSVLFYEAGTTTPVTVYSDEALSTSLGSSVGTNASGQLVTGGDVQTDIYVFAGEYKVVIKDASAATVATYDNLLVRSAPVVIGEGGTGAITAAGARSNLGLVIGTNVQAYDADTAKTDVAETVTASWDFTGGLDVNGSDISALLTPFRNKIINGQFDIWQRGTSFTANGYTADRWRLQEGAGAACTITREAFTVGQTDVPGNPIYFLRFARGTAGTGSSLIDQRIEGVETLSGQTATLTFWVKGSNTTAIFAQAVQNFGSGGSASGNVTTSVAGAVAVTTSWVKKSYTVSIPSISGKTLDGGDDYLTIRIARAFDSTNATADVDIANVSVVAGDATNEADPGAWRHTGEELRLCQRYYEEIDGFNVWNAATTSGVIYRQGVAFKVAKRAVPTVTLTNVDAANFPTTGTISGTSAQGFIEERTANATGSGGRFRSSYTVDAEL